MTKPDVKSYGSLNKVKVDVSRTKPGDTATIRVTYGPLTKARNVETILHLSSGRLAALECGCSKATVRETEERLELALDIELALGLKIRIRLKLAVLTNDDCD